VPHTLTLARGVLTVPSGDMTEHLWIRRGTAADSTTIIRLINEAAAWLASMGTDQWAAPWPSRDERDGRVARGLDSGDTWMIEDDDGRPVATITSRGTGNDQLWDPGELREPAVYVSRLVVTRSYAGSGIGSALIDWAGIRAAREWGARWIRIDVWTTNRALHNYYEKRGFEYVRTCPYDRKTYPSSVLFQKSTSEADGAAESRFADVI
jgi:GNAT superfamily N-acetyltransferase